VLARPQVACGLTFQSAAWAHGLADRAPIRVEVAAATAQDARRLPSELDVSVFAPRLGYVTAKGVPLLRPASIIYSALLAAHDGERATAPTEPPNCAGTPVRSTPTRAPNLSSS
jgi:hypothetical protein